MFEEAKEHHELAPNHLGYNLNQGQKSSREVVDSFKKLGNVFYRLGHFDDAKDYFIRSLKMREELCGEEDAAVASSLNNLGSIYSVLGDKVSTRLQRIITKDHLPYAPFTPKLKHV